MAKKGLVRARHPPVSQEKLAALLSAAVENRHDFVLAWEPRPDEELPPGTELRVHVMTGNLVTHCRLNGIMGRALLYEDEGAGVVTFAAGTDPTARRKK